MKAVLATLVGLMALGGMPAQAAPYAIDPTHTIVTFEVLHLGTSTSRGRFEKKEGTLEFDRDGKAGKIDISIDTTSISTAVPALDRELQGDKFFNTAKFPSARFVSERFAFEGDKLAAVSGNFTLLGVTQPLTLKATRFSCYFSPFLKREVCGGDFEASLQRSRFGMTTYSPDMVGENVRLLIQVEAIKQ